MSPFFSFFRTDFSHDGALLHSVWLGGDWWVAEGVAGRTALLAVGGGVAGRYTLGDSFTAALPQSAQGVSPAPSPTNRPQSRPPPQFPPPKKAIAISLKKL